MKATCPRCKYEWDTNAVLDNLTCPNCLRKFPRGDDKSQKKK